MVSELPYVADGGLALRRRVEVLTFDCFGTLIDWETGLLDGLRNVLDTAGVAPSGEQLLEAYAKHEQRWESGPYLSYREVLRRSLAGVCAGHGVVPTLEQGEAFAESVARWPAFPDTAPALLRLSTRYRLGIITNCDDDLFARAAEQLGVPLAWVVTAQQAGRYKPHRRPFELALARIGLPRERILHVAQSLYHDHVPAKSMGLSTVWIDRRRGRRGSGATPPAVAEPDLALPDLASLADLLA